MSEFKNGMRIEALASGKGEFLSGWGSYNFTAGAQFTVTSVRSGLHARPDKGSYVVKLPRSVFKIVTRRFGEVPADGIAAEDPRIAWLFEDAARMADRLGLCRDFDRICDALGIPGRIRKFKIKVGETEGLSITATVEARSKREAEQRLRGAVSNPAALRAIGAGS